MTNTNKRYLSTPEFLSYLDNEVKKAVLQADLAEDSLEKRICLVKANRALRKAKAFHRAFNDMGWGSSSRYTTR